MQNIRKWGAYLGAGAVILGLAGCADRNKNGEPDSPATTGEISNAVDSAGNKMEGAAKDAAPKMEAAANKAGAALKNLGEAAVVTPKVQAALDTNPGLKGVKINADTLGSKDSVALRGKVKSASQKTLAEALAKKNAPGYKIIDQLTVVK